MVQCRSLLQILRSLIVLGIDIRDVLDRLPSDAFGLSHSCSRDGLSLSVNYVDNLIVLIILGKTIGCP